MPRRTLNRRALLLGAGTVAVGLPFLEEMNPVRAQGAKLDAPARLLTLFFGLGIAREQVLEQFQGPLGPYEPLKEKMAFFSKLDMAQAHDHGSGTVHFKTGDVVFVGEPQKREYEAAGPSIEEIMKKELHPQGVPTRIGSKSAGLWFRTGAISQYVKQWNYDGSPGEKPERRPSRLFDAVFGGFLPPGSSEQPSDPALERELRIKRSILDTVVEQYQHHVSPASMLGAASKAKLQVHLDRIRDVERRLVPTTAAVDEAMASAACVVPATPSDPAGVPYDLAQAGTGAGAPEIRWQDFQAAYQLIGEIYALALRCDLFRFGSLVFVGAGGHVQFREVYEAQGMGGTLNFTATLQNTTPHDAYFHKNDWASARIYQHLSQTCLAHVLKELDDPLFLERNGKTVLDNTLAVVGTEYGGGGNGSGHNPNDVFHAVAGGHGLFRPGFYDQPYNVIDLYDTLLKAYGINSGIGTRHASFRHTPVSVTQLLA